MTQQLGFSFDPERCSGCMACIVACQDQNDLPGDGAAFRRVNRLERGGSSPRLAFLSLACLHCGDAPCLMACPTGAIFRQGRGGIIQVDRDLCVGCHSCALACPFGAPQFLEDGRMAKCDFCAVRMEHGLKPACVRVCPTRALDLGPLNNLADQKAAKASRAILEALTFKASGTPE